MQKILAHEMTTVFWRRSLPLQLIGQATELIQFKPGCLIATYIAGTHIIDACTLSKKLFLPAEEKLT